MDSPDKMKFPKMVRDLRVARGLKQREVADYLGLATSSYGNVESRNFKSLSIDRVRKLARLYELPAAAEAELAAAWEGLPVSPYNLASEPARERRRVARSKVKMHDKIKLALLEITTLLVSSAQDPDSLCACQVDILQEPTLVTEPCEICNALRLLGLPGWTDAGDVIEKLAQIQGKLETGAQIQ